MAILAAVENEVLETGAPTWQRQYIQWSPVVLGAFAAAALSFILISFGLAVGLGISSTSSTWRDTSAALALLSGIYLILQAVISFGFGGYIAGRTMASTAAVEGEDDRERRDGMHGLASWALAVLIGAMVAALFASSALDRSSNAGNARTPGASSAEPLLSYELDRLFRSTRRPPNADIREARAEAGRILLKSSGHDGVSTDDRNYLVQQVAALTGLQGGEADKRVDTAIADARTAIARTRRSSIIIAFSIATATLLGSVAAWAAAVAGGRHRDGAPLASWMQGSNAFHRRRRLPIP